MFREQVWKFRSLRKLQDACTRVFQSRSLSLSLPLPSFCTRVIVGPTPRYRHTFYIGTYMFCLEPILIAVLKEIPRECKILTGIFKSNVNIFGGRNHSRSVYFWANITLVYRHCCCFYYINLKKKKKKHFFFCF